MFHFCFISVSLPSAQQIQHLAVLRSILPVFYHNRMELEDSVCRCWAGLLLRTSGSFICQFAFCINSHSVQHYINCIYGKFSEACVYRICAHTVVHLELSARLPFVALDSVTKHIWFTLILRVIVLLRRSGRRGEDVTAVGRRCNSKSSLAAWNKAGYTETFPPSKKLFHVCGDVPHVFTVCKVICFIWTFIHMELIFYDWSVFCPRRIPAALHFFINLNTLKYTHTHVISEKVQIGHLNSALC